MNIKLEPQGTIDAVPGFTAHGVHAGLKHKDPDLALVHSAAPCTAAGAFTTNKFAAPPVHVTRTRLDEPVHAIVCNSAIANACTGPQGFEDAEAMARVTAQALNIPPLTVLVASTGLIGEPLPMGKITDGIHALTGRLDRADGAKAAEAITTTDTHPKHASCTVTVEDRTFTIGAMAKGSGMIHPNMATMLAFVATDAPIHQAPLQALVYELVDETFNMITVDGDESTNDMVLVLANGQEKGPALEPGTDAYRAFKHGLETVFDRMARAIAGDGEGARALLEVHVHGAETKSDAQTAARAVAASNLVKTALHGQDPNWGRIVAALGATNARVEPDRVHLTLEGNGHQAHLLHEGQPPTNGALETARNALTDDEVAVHLDLGIGPHHAKAYGCDLSEEYVTVNAEYTT